MSVVFDIKRGAVADAIVPEGSVSPDELQRLLPLALPEAGQSGEEGSQSVGADGTHDTVYCFRVRADVAPTPSASFTAPDEDEAPSEPREREHVGSGAHAGERGAADASACAGIKLARRLRPGRGRGRGRGLQAPPPTSAVGMASELLAPGPH